MSNESVVVIILRLAGFFIGASTLWRLIQLLLGLPLTSAAALKVWYVWLIFSVIVLAFSWMLIQFPRLITRRLLARKEAEETAAPWSLDDFQAVLFAVLGLYFATLALASGTGWVVELVWALSDEKRSLPFFSVAGVASELFRLGIGLWLLFGARGLRGLIRNARRAGRQSNPLPPGEGDERR